MLKRVLMLLTAVLLISNTGLIAQDEALENAKNLIQQEQFDEAQSELNGILNGDARVKNADEIYYWLGVIKYRQDAFDQAKSFFERAIAEKSKSAFGHAGLGLMLMIEQNYADANQHLQDAQTYSKGKIPEVVFALAEAYLKGTAPEIAEAKRLLYAYRQEDPEDPRTYIMLAKYYMTDGVPELAIEEYENAIEKDPSYVAAYADLAQLYYERGKESRSAEDYQKGYEMVSKALELDPDYAPAYRIRAELYLISNTDDRFERARADIEKYLELAGNDLRAKVRYVQFLFLTGDYELVLNEMDNIDTTTNVLRRLKGMSLEQMGRYDEAQAAMDEYFEAVREQYHTARDYEVYGDILRKKGDREGADVYYQKAMALAPAQYETFYPDLADFYKGEARKIEGSASELRNQAKELEATAMEAYNGANAAAEAGDAAGRDSLKAVMDGAVADREALLAKADSIESGAIAQYELEAYYRDLAITFADPITLKHLMDHAIALYKAEKWRDADAAFIKVSELKADYMQPYTYRFRIASELEKEDPEVQNWLAKDVSDDVVEAFVENKTGEGLSSGDLNILLISYEVQALYAFDPEGDNEDYKCEDAQPWIDLIIAIDPNYARIQPVKEFCDQQ